MSAIPATHVSAPRFYLSVQEYDVDGSQMVLLRATSHAVVTLGVDLDPAVALELAEALTKHANGLLSKREAIAKARGVA